MLGGRTSPRLIPAPMDIALTHRLSFKQASLTVLVAFILGTLLSLIQVGVDYASQDASINREVRALLAELAGAGLRLIEIERDHLADLPRVVEQLQGLPQRFVLFCDDLSFDAGEGDYRVLKSVLDGSLEQAPDNVLLYATSNRRHLVSEKQSDNENWKMVDGELHPNEAVEDKIALSDRFGLWLSFYPFTQEHFLSVVRHWVDVLAEKAGLAWSWSEELEKEAIRWALGRGNRNGRCAYQFSRYWVGKQLLERQA